MRNYIGLDLGTGTIKGVLWNPQRGIIARDRRRVQLLRPAEKMVEIDAAGYFADLRDLLRTLAAADSLPVEAVAFAAASGNTMLCDDKANSLTPVISWLDRRIDWRPPEAWQVMEVTGWPPMAAFPPAHLEYFKRTVPELLKTAHFAMNNDWVAWKLCGRHAIDYSSAVPSELANRHTRQWEKRYLEYYGLTVERMPELLCPGETIGTLLPEYRSGNLTAGTRIVAGSFDHPAAARACGILHPGDMLLSCGTSWVALLPVAPESEFKPGELYDPFQSHCGGCAAKMFSVEGIGVEIDAFVTGHYGTTPDAYDRFNDDPAARPLMRSVVRKLQRLLGDRLPARIVMTGGPSEGRAWREILTETMPMIEFSEMQSYAGAAGAAMLAEGAVK